MQTFIMPYSIYIRGRVNNNYSFGNLECAIIVVISLRSSIHRTFGKGQWQLIHDRLSLWKESIQSLKSNLKTIKSRPP